MPEVRADRRKRASQPEKRSGNRRCSRVAEHIQMLGSLIAAKPRVIRGTHKKTTRFSQSGLWLTMPLLLNKEQVETGAAKFRCCLYSWDAAIDENRYTIFPNGNGRTRSACPHTKWPV